MSPHDGRRRIALFGGTFDPVHFGHLECAQRAKDVAELDEVIFMPCSRPHLKPDQDVAPGSDRMAMCRLACLGNPSFTVSDMEVRRGGITYTIDTVEEMIGTMHDDSRIDFILGTDAFLTLHEWKGFETLRELIEFIVVLRPGDSLHSAREYARANSLEMIAVDCPGIDISSSYIRDLLKEGRSVRYLTPQSVIAYIGSRGLYVGAKALGELDHVVDGPRGADHGCLGSQDCPSETTSDAHALGASFRQERWNDLKGRVSKKRLKHIEGVADTSRELATIYGIDPDLAYLAGLLHDWDKGLDDDQIRERVRELGIEGEMDPFVMEKMPQVLHGPTAAYALASEFPEIPYPVIRAIYEHTTSSPRPDDLSKVLYIADAIEPTRTFDGVDRYRGKVGEVSLDELFLDIYKFWTLALVKRGKPLHPDTVDIWNALVGR